VDRKRIAGGAALATSRIGLETCHDTVSDIDYIIVGRRLPAARLANRLSAIRDQRAAASKRAAGTAIQKLHIPLAFGSHHRTQA